MNKPSHDISLDEQLRGAVDRETMMVAYYDEIGANAGPDAEAILKRLREHHADHIALLEHLMDEIEILRDLTLPIAD
ncbi:MAG TPA: hypothetical protein VL633_10265 [Bacteroidota bacterium]|jgi:hypothetical protein|nr:hypothetical protein [Bacteroidota bacterium]